MLSQTSPTATARLTVARLRFEHWAAGSGASEAVGIGVDRPRLSWEIETAAQDWRQAAYELEARRPDGSVYGGTGRVASGESVLVPWPFAPLESRRRLTVRVRVWGTPSAGAPSAGEADDAPSDWSAVAVVEAGLLRPADWSAAFITPAWDEDISRPQPAPFFRRAFVVREGLQQARLYITALGLYEAQLNGQPVGDHVMAPGWTSYDHRLRYQTFDVTALLAAGPNALGALVADGWYRGRLGYHRGRRNIYGDRLGLLAQLELTYADGATERIVTDASWAAATGPLLASDIYDGETYDARRELDGWSAPGYDDSGWAGVRVLERDLGTLVAPSGPPIRRIETRAPVAITTSPAGRTLLDFGQNLVGRLRLTVHGPAGQTITLRHAEVLEDGELCVRPLRYAAATDRYTLKGSNPASGAEVWEPRFTFHGFRYAEVTGWPGALTPEAAPEAVQAVVIHSDMARTGWFECSDPLVNRLHENVVWSMRGNFLDIPTDCPQRDERLGWTGDIQVFAPTASFLYDSAGFLQSWLADVAAEQAASGGIVPMFVPNVMAPPASAAAAWGDAAVIVPWVLYERYADANILAAQFQSMCQWVEVVANAAGPGRLWEQGLQFGDWLDPKAPPDKPGDARTAAYLVATAYFARSAELTGRAAGVLGRTADERRYLGLAAEVRDAFAREYVTPAGRMVSDATTAYALAIQFALLPSAEQRRAAGKRLAALVRGSGYRISTGFVGTPLVCDALSGVGEYEAAYRLLMQRRCPSWLYPVTMGATTIWERWDSMLSDGSVNPGDMTSFNHYALGAVADWLHRTVAGLAPAAPGFRSIEIRPVPGDGLTHARAQHRTPYGLAECGWRIADGHLTVEVTIPPNTTATVHLPGRDDAPLAVGAGRYTWRYPYAVPTPAGQPLTLDSTVGELIDSPVVYDQVMNIFETHNPEFADRMNGQTEVTLREAVLLNPNPETLAARIEAALAAIKT